MPDQDQDAGVTSAAVPTPRPPIPDLGFFAGSSAPAGSSFGAPAPTAPFAAPSTGFGSPPDNQFGTPAPAPFGAPAPFSPGAPAAWQGQVPAPAPPTTGGNGWKIGVAIAGVVVLVAVVLGGRFGYQQFIADPVLPETLAGMPKVGDISDQEIRNLQDGMSDELSSGSAARVALYSDGQGTGYMLFAVRGGSDAGSGSGEDPFSGWTKTEPDGTTCYRQPAQAAAGAGVTMCMHGFWRRAVFVMGMGATPPDPTIVAQATDEAWSAQ